MDQLLIYSPAPKGFLLLQVVLLYQSYVNLCSTAFSFATEAFAISDSFLSLDNSALPAFSSVIKRRLLFPGGKVKPGWGGSS